jgi:hypothetical protein
LLEQVVDEDRSWIEPSFGSFAHGPLQWSSRGPFLGWLVGFAAGFLVTLVAAVIILPTLGPVRTLMLVAGSLTGLALKARRRRARPARIVERRAPRMTVRWRWRGDGLGA